MSSEFTIGQINAYNAATGYAGTWVSVPLDATNITSSQIDLATDDPPESTIAAGAVEEQWHGLYFGRPANQAAYTGLKTLPFKVPSTSDAWIAVYSFGSVGSPSTSPYGKTMRWRYTATYTVPGACPAASAAPPSTPTTSPAKATVATESNGYLKIGVSWPVAPAKIELKVVPPAGHTITRIDGGKGLSCTNDASYAECTSSSTGVKIDSVIADLSPPVTGTVTATTETTDGTTDVNITIPAPELAESHAKLEDQIAALKSIISEFRSNGGNGHEVSERLTDLARQFSKGSAAYTDLEMAARSAFDAGTHSAVGVDEGAVTDAFKYADAALAMLTVLAGK